MFYNINPEKWGPHYWKMSHYITIAYPKNPTEEDKKSVKMYFYNLVYLLPCENCRNHYAKNLNKFPLTEEILASRYKLIKWLVDIHNEVNRRTGKPEISINDIENLYLNDNNVNYNQIIMLSILGLLVIILIIYMKNKNK